MKVYIFGHKQPDTDSVCSSIALSYLKNKLGMDTSPKVLGTINNETKFVLDYFNLPEPGYLNDVKVQIRYMNYNKEIYLEENNSIRQTYKKLDELNITGIPIVDENKKLKGYVNLKEISKYLIDNRDCKIITSYNNIVKDLEGKEILKYSDEIQGEVNFYDKPSSIYIIQNIELLKRAIKLSPALIIFLGDNIPTEILKDAQNNQVNIISTNKGFYYVINQLKQSNYIKEVDVVHNPIKFYEKDFRGEYLEAAKKYGHTNYPVIKKNQECLGMIRLIDQDKYEKRKVILVDHNQISQSVDGLEEAEIIEIVDHHNLGTIGTNIPISFRSMPVGSTSTIIYQMFKESNVVIPIDIAGIMLSSIISDTLMLKSPTTTEIDRKVVENLSELIKLDINDYAYKMFKAGSSINNMSSKEIINQDFKSYKLDEGKIGIGQIITMDVEQIKDKQQEYIEILNQKVNDSDYQLAVFFVTDILQNGSYIFFNEKAKNIIEEAYDIEGIKQGTFIENAVSRKKQMLPPILQVLETKN